jgi:Holliday junction resolvase-like predicted endonuclease
MIQNIDAAERVKNEKFPHIQMTIEDFCQGTTDESRIQCILDCPSIDGDKPSLIKYDLFFFFLILFPIF